MSFLNLLRKLVDPLEARREEEERRRQREDVGATRATVEPPPEPPPAPTKVCRVCGHEGTGRFCPSCLAETMEARR